MKKTKKTKAPCGGEFDGRPELYASVKDRLKRRVDLLSSMAASQADVLKFLLTELKEVGEAAKNFNSAFGGGDPIRLDSLDRAAGYIDDALDGELREEAEPGPERYEATDTALVQALFAESKFAIDPGEMRAFRRPALDDYRGLAYEFVANAGRVFEDGPVSFSFVESFVSFLSADKCASVKAFDEKVANLAGMRFLTKEEAAKAAKEREEAVEYYKKAEPVVRDLIKEKAAVTKKAVDERIRKSCAGKCGKCKRHEDKKDATFSGVLSSKSALEGLKQFLLKTSRYAIPSNRFQVLFDREDRKSQKFVYELRFFQKGGCRKDETVSYEMVPLRIRMDGDRGDLIAKRFDKAVSELRFNEFPEKK